MNYKKKYKEALERAQQAVDKGQVSQNFVDDIFPELKDSENERMRREIIDFLRLPHPQFVGKRDHEKWIAWLEKQDEPKESEEERIRKGLIKTISSLLDNTVLYHTDITKEEALAWLEKQKGD